MENLFLYLGPALLNMGSIPVLVAIISGVTFGVVLGALPGFGSSQSLALLFPLTFAMPADVAIIFFLAVYSAAEYGGSIPAILIRTPGTPAQAVTVLDGYALAQKGYPNRALKISLVSGVIGGISSTLIFIFVGGWIASIALEFGPGEMFALGLFGLSIIGSFFGRDPTRGFLAAGLGLFLSTIGSSDFGGMRFTFNQGFLTDGIPLVVVIIAFLAGPEALRLLISHRKTVETPKTVLQHDAQKTDDRLQKGDMIRLIPTWIRCSLIGTAIGAIPGAGASIGSLIAYGEEKRWSKRPKEEFGTGIPEGLAAPETANNAVVAGTLVPSLTLGIPGSGSAAILLSVLISKGIVPGPLLFGAEPELITTIFVGLIFINIWLLILGLIYTRGFAYISNVARRILGPFVFILILLGTYAYANYTAHVVMVIVFSLVAYWMVKIDIPVVPVVLAFVMGPIIETNMSRAMTIHAGDLSVVLARPITLTILALALATFLYSAFGSMRSKAVSQGKLQE
ncbi:tripartite tricarboxylate transporter permease [Parasedimentitalea psychrophila]|uniref:Tripartite tricarboxylate transporter permease n=1 Tax=Parasedimentitalea psychrophila TaxID=2997337 RepID=A0A9Y2P2E2_9RHOB|nr:tripartite tricarboxylate transporter permease [Parasedimentitalea psychrophila]WIY26566.1 tripartite tricarboxylate transporter permease [Parasedimentitalea psychrophila]